jgi:hypothetical protein
MCFAGNSSERLQSTLRAIVVQGQPQRPVLSLVPLPAMAIVVQGQPQRPVLSLVPLPAMAIAV